MLDLKHSLQSLQPKETSAFAPDAEESCSRPSPILCQTQCLQHISFNLEKSLDVPTIPFRVMVQGPTHNHLYCISVLCSKHNSGF